MKKEVSNSIIVYDSSCNLCNGSVQFIKKYDINHIFSFSPLNCEDSNQTKGAIPDNTGIDSIQLIENGMIYRESTAALMIGSRLKHFKLLAILLFIPKGIRDPVYRLIARNRYRWFGRKETC
jgi:predicted DCC family thiol-disulfide oxidoreductase YuxK